MNGLYENVGCDRNHADEYTVGDKLFVFGLVRDNFESIRISKFVENVGYRSLRTTTITAETLMKNERKIMTDYGKTHATRTTRKYGKSEDMRIVIDN